MSTIIITGVAGFVGSNLALTLLKAGHRVYGIDNFSYGNRQNIAGCQKFKDFIFVHGDVCDPSVLREVSGDVLVHLASQKIPRYTNALTTLEDNSNMTKQVVSKCIQDRIKLVFASTSDVYGKNPQIPYHENSDSLFGTSTVKRWAYALSKLHSEHYIIAQQAENNLEYTIMRFFGSYGPNQNRTWWGGPQSVFIQNILEGKPIELHGDGLQTRTFTYVDDTVQGVVKCIFEDAARNEIYNIANHAHEEISIKDLATLIWELMHGGASEPDIRYIPYATFGNYEDVRRRVPDISKIINQLGFQPKYSLREGLEKTIEWQKSVFK